MITSPQKRVEAYFDDFFNCGIPSPVFSCGAVFLALSAFSPALWGEPFARALLHSHALHRIEWVFAHHPLHLLEHFHLVPMLPEVAIWSIGASISNCFTKSLT